MISESDGRAFGGLAIDNEGSRDVWGCNAFSDLARTSEFFADG